MSKGKRPAPAYQEYAASMLTRMEYREASMAARGLLDTLRRECWVNHRMPSDPVRLARVLGTSEDLAPLLAEIVSLFEFSGEHLTCPELESYRQEIEHRHMKQSSGGKQGAEKTNEAKRNRLTANPSGNSTATPSGSSRVLSIDKNSIGKTSQNQSLERADIPRDEFISSYETFESNDSARIAYQ